MSKMINGTVDVNCSTEIMINAIATLFPEWMEFLESGNGNLRYQDYYGEELGTNASIVIRGGIRDDEKPTAYHRGVTAGQSDIALVRGSDGKWKFTYDHLNKNKDFDSELATEVAKGKVQEVLRRLGAKNVQTKAPGKSSCVIEAVISHESLSKMRF